MGTWVRGVVVALVMTVGVLGQNTATVTVTAQGSYKAEPDTAVVGLEVQGKNAEVQAAYRQAQDEAARVRTLLQQQGFKSEQAHWSGFQVQPNYDYKLQRVTSYTVSEGLSLEVTDFARIGPLLNAATGTGMSALRNVGFELSHPEEAKQKAIADAYGKVHGEAEALARAAGARLAGLQSATLDASSESGPRPVPMFARAAVAGAPAPTESFTPQEITVTANVTAVYRLGQ